MKLLLQPDELSHAVKNYLRDTYSLYGEVEVQELHEVEVDIKPRNYDYVANDEITEINDTPDEEYDTTREDALGRADHLGIKYRADISIDKLIERIEEYEIDMANLPIRSDGNELPLENDVDDVVELDEPLEEEANETIQEVEEVQPQKKKKSIFDKSE